MVAVKIIDKILAYYHPVDNNNHHHENNGNGSVSTSLFPVPNQYQTPSKKREATLSFEFFPAKTEAGVFNLLNRVEEMGFNLQPTFVTLTWRSAFEDAKLWLRVGSHIQNEFNIDVLLHLTCHLPKDELKKILHQVREAGIRNILALRGDPPIGSEQWKPVENGFKNAIELIQMIRQEHGDYFCIACAGYPEVHTESWNNPDLPPSNQAKYLDLQRLKEKQDAGADFIITQFFFDTENLIDWMKRCREIGIFIPILPGYLPIQNYNSFKKFTGWCKTAVPSNIVTDLEVIKSDDAAVKQYGIELAIKTCKTLLDNGVKSLHFYTMNLASTVTKVLDGLNMIPRTNERELPWKSLQRFNACSSPKGNNRMEEIRPIFWANRQASYLSRTSDWDDFPNGRWGDRRSPAYGDLSDYYLAYKRPKVDRKLIWGVPTSHKDVYDVFVGYIEGSIRQLPWCEQGLSGESVLISENLRWINSMGFLTINSQPRVNGAPSSDLSVGWGGDHGYVFQKAYVEFFTSPDLMSRLLNVLVDYPEMSYHALDLKGKEYGNAPKGSVNAVTWGVFPGKEIIQPTVVDSSSFIAWKEEAFELWMSQWASAYDIGSESNQVIKEIYSNYFLVNIVDNDYTNANSDIFSVFKRVIAEKMDKNQLQERVFSLEEQNEKLRETVVRLQNLQMETSNDLKQANDHIAEIKKENSQLLMHLRNMKVKLAVQDL